MPAMSPRSILKQTSSSLSCPDVPSLAHALPYPPPPPQVHFPPTPSLTQTGSTFNNFEYDRSPIVVLPNDCALPERGCPGRTYDGRSAKVALRPGHGGNSGKHPHPRVAEASGAGRIPYYGPLQAPPPLHSPPALIPDLSSESEESDGVVSPPPEYLACSTGAVGQHYSRPVHFTSSSQEQLDKLSFLPHPPSPSKKDSQKRDKEHRRRSDTTRFKSEDGTRSFATSSLDGCLGGF